MIGNLAIHGHAIVSVDDRIADADGTMPPALGNDADWARFQAALDAAAVVVLGRKGHETNPNRKGRNRLVLSSSARGLERRPDGWWWNPADLPAAESLGRAAPQGGIAAVPGGRRVFDLFLGLGYDEFHLARAGLVRIPGGIPIFTAVRPDRDAERILAQHGLVADGREILDAAASVSLTKFRMP